MQKNIKLLLFQGKLIFLIRSILKKKKGQKFQELHLKRFIFRRNFLIFDIKEKMF